jgi:hypothetical protein
MMNLLKVLFPGFVSGYGLTVVAGLSSAVVQLIGDKCKYLRGNLRSASNPLSKRRDPLMRGNG